MDGDDSDDNNANICSDTDGDTCDDCSSGTYNVSSDGFDYDADGACNAGDSDDDNDGALDGDDSDDNNANVCSDTDGDTCDDCSSGTYNVSSDGFDYDADGACDAGDSDDDNDGALDGVDSEDNNEFICNDDDGDTCDECSSGSYDSSNDGFDYDADGACDAGDSDDDNDGALDENDSSDNLIFVCSDNDGDTCEDCLSGTYNLSNDGSDIDFDGMCDAGDICIHHYPDDPDNNGACGTNPVLSAIGSKSTLEDISFTVDLSSTDVDSDNNTYPDNATYTIEDIENNDLFVSSIDGSTITINPNLNKSGTGSILVTVTDDFGGTDTELVSIEVVAVADAPNLSSSNIIGDEDVSNL